MGDEETEEVAEVGQECCSCGRKFEWWICSPFTSILKSITLTRRDEVKTYRKLVVQEDR